MSTRPRLPTRTATALAALLVVAPVGVLAACTSSHPTPRPAGAQNGTPTGSGSTSGPVTDADYGRGLSGNGRLLHPAGRLVAVGNAPTGGALTPDGRFFWSVSTGRGRQDVRVVRVDGSAPVVVQVLPVPGVSGGLAFDPRQPVAYLSGVATSRAADQARPDLPGAAGDVVQVLRYDPTSGRARVERVFGVPPPPGAPAVQSFPPSSATRSWPDRLAVSPDGRRLLVPLNLADAAAVIDTRTGSVRTMPVGHYPYGAAVLRDGRTGLITNEADGTVTVVDLDAARALATVRVGANLSHPEAVVADPSADRAFVAVANSDQVVVLDTRARTVAATVSVERPEGLGGSPVALGLAPDRGRLYVAEQGADDLSVIGLPADGAPPSAYRVTGRVPTAGSPSAVAVGNPRCAGGASRCPLLVWQAAKGLGVGPNPHGPAPTDPRDTVASINSFSYLPSIVTGQVGTLAPPSDNVLRAATKAADTQLVPVSRAAPPTGTPIRPGGPIKHVFFVVRENRTYDQVLGDVPRGDGDAGLALFGPSVTPNVHGLVGRFPLLDHVLADSEASIDGHFWTSAAAVSDYVQQNWPQNYGQRGRPYDFGVYSVSWPGNRFLFDQARKQGISAFNYGEALAGTLPLPDKDRDATGTAASVATLRESDLGAGIPALSGASPAGRCYPNDAAINKNPLTGHLTWDSTPPSDAPAGGESRVYCFRQRFARQLAADAVPALSYLVLPNDHTAGVTPGQRTPQALVADNDLGLGQLVDTVSHSAVWASSLVVVVEDDSQDGADHVDAHRIPALVISPYARRGAVVHTRYDLLSAIRTMELVLGMRPLGLGDAMATPMYDAFSPTPDLEPWTAVVPRQDRAATSTAASPGARASSRLDLSGTDTAPQRALDEVLWQTVHGDGAAAPPPGPEPHRGSDQPRTLSTVCRALDLRRCGVVVLSLLGTALLPGCGARGAQPTVDSQPAAAVAEAVTAPACRPAPLAARAARTLVVGLPDTTSPDDVLAGLVPSLGVGGVLLTQRNVSSAPQVRTLIAGIRHSSHDPLLVTIDEEGGRVSSLLPVIGASRSAREQAALGPAAVTRRATEVARTLHDLGLTGDLAPDADVDGGPWDGSIGDRSPSASPIGAGQDAVLAARALAAGGIVPR